MKLSPIQQELLDYIRKVSDEHKSAKATLRAELERELRARLNSRLMALEDVVLRGVEAGIPKRQIGMEALGTSNPNTPADYARRAMERAAGLGLGTVEPSAYNMRAVRTSTGLYIVFVTGAELDNPTVKFPAPLGVPPITGYAWTHSGVSSPFMEFQGVDGGAPKAPKELRKWAEKRFPVHEKDSGAEWVAFLKSVEQLPKWDGDDD